MAYMIIPASDGGYLISGYTVPSGETERDVYLIKVNEGGSEVWSRTYGGSGSDYGRARPSGTGYIIAGSTNSYGTGGYDGYLIKIDQNGNTLWSSTFGTATNDEIFATVIQTEDGGYLCAGQKAPSGTEDREVYIVKTDQNGNEIWSKTGGDQQLDDVHRIIETSDGNYILIGITRENGGYDTFITKMDQNGNTIWHSAIGSTHTDYAMDIIELSDGSFVLTGSIYLTSANIDVFLTKINSLGNQLWTKTYGGYNTDYGMSLLQTPDGGFIINAFTGSYDQGEGEGDLFIIKTDTSGNAE